MSDLVADAAPWTISEGTENGVVVRSGAYIVARVFSSPATPTYNNARLIAAAPELLQACTLARDYKELNTEAFVAKYGPGITWGTVRGTLDAAITKATGA